MVTSSWNLTTINLMPVSKKLVHDNHVVWKVHVLAAFRGAQLVDFLNGTNEAPAAKLKIKVSKEDAGDDEVSNLAYDL
jgi:hypothetical protein